MDVPPTTMSKLLLEVEVSDASEDYVLIDAGEILQKLLLLHKNRCELTVKLDAEDMKIQTRILDIPLGQNILVFDRFVGRFREDNLRNMKNLEFKASYEGVIVAFEVERMETFHNDEDEFYSCRLPHSLLWLQRRKTFRAKVPTNVQAACTLYLSNDVREFNVVNISLGGLALDDPHSEDIFSLGTKFDRCRLQIDGFVDIETAMVVRSVTTLLANDEVTVVRKIGCQFTQLQGVQCTGLQKFVQYADQQDRRRSKG